VDLDREARRMTIGNHHISFIGFGEAARAFLSGWALPDPARVAAYDIKVEQSGTTEAMRDRYAEAGVRGCVSPAEAVAQAAMVFSVVTADQALAAAQAAAPHLPKAAFWFDCNSCAPATKRRAAQVIEAVGGRYVDVAVMAPVYPKRHHVPLNIAGPHAEAAADVLRGLDMKPVITGPEVGHASSIKMIRSVMIKGLEALVAECFLSARRAGVEEQVLASLEASDPDIAWRKRGAYNLERMMVHGARRASELREVAITVEDLCLPGLMSAATAEWEDKIAALKADPGDDDLTLRLDAILARL
jgi:3-hydroxyisobutyrate dehydrogenase-like beta-hydroxyacid dehydrogenase